MPVTLDRIAQQLRAKSQSLLSVMRAFAATFRHAVVPILKIPNGQKLKNSQKALSEGSPLSGIWRGAL